MEKWIDIIIILVEVGLLTVIGIEFGILVHRWEKNKETFGLAWGTVSTVLLFCLLSVSFRGNIKRCFQRCIRRLWPEQEMLEVDFTPSPPAEGVLEPVRPAEGVLEPVRPAEGVLEPVRPAEGVLEPVRPAEGVLEPVRPAEGVLEPVRPAEGVGEAGRPNIPPPQGGALAPASGHASADAISSSSTTCRPEAVKVVQRSCPELSLAEKSEVGGPE